ncbi:MULTISPECIES: DoxX family protein [Pseudomonas]|uniref:DoxX family protein n=1 Tax=Pseudomonas TaxID=286 RepID=UPI000DA71154|nr:MULTISPECIES: DoxX family membrane protein [Pseudomonas]MDW3716253.1 DoxX family membrane protein [Pseudomonas sp. 2023EL-01195]PZE10353.1 LysR family transcriptional regulator [Pseudomonas sp. 57B-090624]
MANAATTLPPAGPSDWGLLFLRASGALLLLWVHGLPKLLGFSQELRLIEDPLHLGALPTLLLAIFAEVACPLAILCGTLTRLACVPILVVLLVSLVVVHPGWSIAEGQFAWLLLIVFTTLLISGPGALAWPLPRLGGQGATALLR